MGGVVKGTLIISVFMVGRETRGIYIEWIVGSVRCV